MDTFKELDAIEESERWIAELREKANAMTPDSLAELIKALPKGDVVKTQELLDLIDYVSDAKCRHTLAMVAQQNLVGSTLKNLAGGYVRRAKEAVEHWRLQEQQHAEEKIRAKQEAMEAEETHPTGESDGASKIIMPSWTKKYRMYEGRPFAWSHGEDSVPLHSPVGLLAGLTYPDRMVQGRESMRGILIAFENEAREIKTLPFTRSEIATRAGQEKMMADLAGAGVSFTPRGRDELVAGVLASGGALADGGRIFDFPGWREDSLFLTPGVEVIGASNQAVAVAKPLPGIRKAGTLEAWRDAIAPAFGEEVIAKAPHVPATILFGFVSPLLDRAQEEMSFILSIAGRTTTLKTFSLRLKASVWGSTEPKVGILVSFNATANRLEDYAPERSGAGLAIDESTLIAGDKLGEFIYRLTSGAEKGRQTQKEIERRWRIACAFSSEVPVEQLIRAAGYEVTPGTMSRVVEIEPTGERVSDEAVDQMKAAFENYGHAGPEFIRAMIAGDWTREKIAAAIKERVAKLLGGAGEREQERRAVRAITFIWLAGEIARDAGLVPDDFDVEAFAMALGEKARAKADTVKPLAARIYGALAAGLLDGSVTILSPDGDALATGTVTPAVTGALCVSNFGKKGEAAFVLPSATLARIVGARETIQDAAKILDEDGGLLRERKDRLYWRGDRAGIGTGNAFVIYANAVLGEDHAGTIDRIRLARRGKGNTESIAGIELEAGTLARMTPVLN